MDYPKLQEEIKTGKAMINFDTNTLDYVQKPIGSALYKAGKNTKSDKKDLKQIVTCDVCGREYTKWNKTHHTRTKVHQLYAKVNQRMTELLLKK
jgi:hypothetical protein